jgi:hypothetical protein
MDGSVRLEQIELLPLLCGLADQLRHRSCLIEITVQVDRACPACVADPGLLQAALADLVNGVCDSMPGCRHAVWIEAREDLPSSQPRHVRVTFAHDSANPTFATIAIVHAFADQYDGSVDSEYWTPAGMAVSLRLPLFHEALPDEARRH